MGHGPNNQRGVALIVALVILVLVTLAGVATLESTGMQLKMTNADQEHQQAFEAAEAALRMVETDVQENTGNWLDRSHLYSDCSGTGCFKPGCDDGLCFGGVWLSSDNAPTRCSTVDTSVTTQVIPPWYDSSLDVWNDTGKHREISVTGYSNKVKYIVEFRCFVPKNTAAVFDDTNAAELFRITVRAMSNAGNAEVMVQSTYKQM